mmetsp:Transcript_7222/g.17115  ORF Transcript_7222/g.17115 Transcript_7222/m.17115 type:complete len:216 (+) Transcript_7222:102-749(+)
MRAIANYFVYGGSTTVRGPDTATRPCVGRTRAPSGQLTYVATRCKHLLHFGWVPLYADRNSKLHSTQRTRSRSSGAARGVAGVVRSAPPNPIDAVRAASESTAASGAAAVVDPETKFKYSVANARKREIILSQCSSVTVVDLNFVFCCPWCDLLVFSSSIRHDRDRLASFGIAFSTTFRMPATISSNFTFAEGIRFLRSLSAATRSLLTLRSSAT